MILGGAAAGCAGSAPLLHPAHVLRPGVVSAGAGVSGQVALAPRAQAAPQPGSAAGSVEASAPVELERMTVAPGVAPWIGGRVGIAGDNEAGLTYTGRALRIDARHAFSLGKPTLSVGLGSSAVFGRRPGSGDDGSSVYGGGLDLPVLLGFHTTADLYALWFGPRLGIELLRGRLQEQAAPEPGAAVELAEVSARHFQLGFVLGARAGFRHLHVAVEVGAAYHRADGTVGAADLSLEQATITPGGALFITF